MLANEVMGLRLTNQELIDAALEMENHPDNISPALYGGAVASGVGEDGKSLIWLLPTPPPTPNPLNLPKRRTPPNFQHIDMHLVPI